MVLESCRAAAKLYSGTKIVSVIANKAIPSASAITTNINSETDVEDTVIYLDTYYLHL